MYCSNTLQFIKEAAMEKENVDNISYGNQHNLLRAVFLFYKKWCIGLVCCQSWTMVETEKNILQQKHNYKW